MYTTFATMYACTWGKVIGLVHQPFKCNLENRKRYLVFGIVVKWYELVGSRLSSLLPKCLIEATN